MLSSSVDPSVHRPTTLLDGACLPFQGSSYRPTDFSWLTIFLCFRHRHVFFESRAATRSMYLMFDTMLVTLSLYADMVHPHLVRAGFPSVLPISAVVASKHIKDVSGNPCQTEYMMLNGSDEHPIIHIYQADIAVHCGNPIMENGTETGRSENDYKVSVVDSIKGFG